MLRYEIKKMFGTFGGKLALVLYAVVVVFSCWLAISGFLNYETKWVNELGESEHGLQAVQKLREARNEWEGYLDQEMLTKVIQENSRINATPEGQSSNVQQSNIAYGWKQGFIPIRELINRSYAAGFRTYDYYRADGISVIREETFYGNRTRQLTEWLYDKTEVAYDRYTETEKQYLIGQYEKLETPFYVDYHDGWYQVLEGSVYIPSLGILIIGFLLSGMFANEFKWKADSIYFSTLHGRTKATCAKIKAGLLLVSVLYWSAMLIYSIVTLGYMGFEGGSCVIQFRLWKSPYNITMRQAWVLCLMGGYIGNLFLAALTMFISAKTKSSVIAVITPFVFLFIPSFLQGIADWLDTVIAMMPDCLLLFYQRLGTFDLITIFGKVFRVLDVCLPLYAALTMILVPVIYQEFRKKQIA